MHASEQTLLALADIPHLCAQAVRLPGAGSLLAFVPIVMGRPKCRAVTAKNLDGVNYEI